MTLKIMRDGLIYVLCMGLCTAFQLDRKVKSKHKPKMPYDRVTIEGVYLNTSNATFVFTPYLSYNQNNNHFYRPIVPIHHLQLSNNILPSQNTSNWSIKI